MFIVLVIVSPAAALTIGPFDTPEAAEEHAEALRAQYTKRGFGYGRVVRVHELIAPDA